MIIKHGAFVCGDLGYIARGYMAFIVIVFVHHFMEVRLHKNAFAFLSKPPGKCVCVHGTQTSTRGSAPVESASTVEGRLELVTLSRLSERFESLFIEEMQIRT